MAILPVEEIEATIRPPVGAPPRFWAVLLRNRKFILGATVFLGLLVLAIVGNLVIGAGARRTGAYLPNLSPGDKTLLGTTSLGQSVAAQWTQALPNSMQVGLIAATIGTVVGGLLGLVSGFFGGKVDAVLRVLIDVFLSVPSLLFLILIASLLKQTSVLSMALIIGLFAWSWPARAVRSQALTLKERPFVNIARLSGMSDIEIVVREILPHMLTWLGANFLNAFISAILAEPGLAVLGLGSQRGVSLGVRR
jgi:peptide/nickel transport system permease protein